MTTRQIIDYAENDQALEMRNAFYSALQDKVMAHIEAKKMEVAKTMFNQPDSMATADDVAITQAQ
jgi:hypothetical protein